MNAPKAVVLPLVLALLVAGCTSPDDDGTDPTPVTDDGAPTPTPNASTPVVSATPAATPTATTPSPALDSSTYQLASLGIPTQVKPGDKWNFTLFVNGTLARESTHIGAHYADNDTTDPPTAPGRKDCIHTAGQLPGVFNVSCELRDEGTYYVWGHAQLNDSGELRNWWTAAPAIVKVRNYTLTLNDLPTSPVLSRSNFSFTLSIAGEDNVTSDHIGAHFWNATNAAPAIANAEGACGHSAGTTVGTYTVTCAIANTGVGPKDYYVRGHVRLADSGTTLEWWSAEAKVTVAGNPLI